MLIKGLWKDEKGVQLVQVITYTLMGAAMAALVGYGLTAMARGKMGSLIGPFRNMKSMTGPVTDTSTYGYSTTSDSATNIVTGASGN